jgi:hypothetical protein
LNSKLYIQLKDQLIKKGYLDEIAWAENITPCDTAFRFAAEYAYVVCNSGMKQQIAAEIYKRLWRAIVFEQPITAKIFRHKAKIAAIKEVYNNRDRYFQEYKAAADKLAYIGNMPYMGEIIKYHLAKNLGIGVCKPDRHLKRIADDYGMEPQEMCERLSAATGDKLAVIDMVIWRAANLGLI